MYINPDVESSYKYNDLGKTLYDEVIKAKPSVVIDFGVLNGYSTICMAQACKDNGFGKVKVYDLFEKYDFNRADFARLIRNLKNHGVLEWVEIEQKNFFDWIKNPEPFDLIHIDISNTGDILDLVWDSLQGKGIVLFEGGSSMRDKVGWILKHNKRPISKTRAKFEVINDKFPSISKLL